MDKVSVKKRAVQHLKETRQWLAVHEFGFPDVSENALATRLYEAHRDGDVLSRYRDGKPYKEYRFNDGRLPL